jgi:hypothetical protein
MQYDVRDICFGHIDNDLNDSIRKADQALSQMVPGAIDAQYPYQGHLPNRTP